MEKKCWFKFIEYNKISLSIQFSFRVCFVLVKKSFILFLVGFYFDWSDAAANFIDTAKSCCSSNFVDAVAVVAFEAILRPYYCLRLVIDG